MSAAETKGALGPEEFSGVRLSIIIRLGTFYLLITTCFEVMSQHEALCDNVYGVQNHCWAYKGKNYLELANLDWHRIILGPENIGDYQKPKEKSKLLSFCLYSNHATDFRLGSLALQAILR